MSGLADIASWALRGVRANNNEEGEASGNGNENENENDKKMDESSMNCNDADEVRAKRLARMARLGGQQEQQQEDQQQDESEPMEVDDDKPEKAAKAEKAEADEGDLKPAAKASVNTGSSNAASTSTSTSTDATASASKKKKVDEGSRLQRKKELLLRKTLGIVFSESQSQKQYVAVSLDDPCIAVHTIAEILAARLSLSPTSSSLRGVNSGPWHKHSNGVLTYLAYCHYKSIEERKMLKQDQNELIDICKEITSQTVNYAASALLVPDLFELAHDSHTQLAHAIIASAATASPEGITFGSPSAAHSFYHKLCDELVAQDTNGFHAIIHHMLTNVFITTLKAFETILDPPPTSNTAASYPPLDMLLGLAALCSHKKAALAVAELPNHHFLLPADKTPEASLKITPPPPSTNPLLQQAAAASANSDQPQQQRFLRMMQQAMMMAPKPYLKRSGPALERETLLGLVLRLGLPPEHASVNSNFANAATRTVTGVKTATDGLRRQLDVYRDACQGFIRNLITAGPQARGKVLQWIADALLVNTGATAMRPDRTKCSHPQTLLNLNIVLLKLCDPFIANSTKAKLIDAGFVNCATAHRGVFATVGDDAIPRLAEYSHAEDTSTDTAAAAAAASAASASSTTETQSNSSNTTRQLPVLIEGSTYNPKNAFIPTVFFFTARALDLGLGPSISSHTSLYRQVHHTAWMLRQRNADLSSDPQFNHILTHQYAADVTVLHPDMLADAIRFYNMAAGFLVGLEKEELGSMPEHLVDDLCNVLTYVARMAPKVMQGLDFSQVFAAVVRLLSPELAQTVRNYNLRAKLGDVLYDVFLPSSHEDDGGSGSSSSVPPSVPCDPQTGGQPYLLSSPSAQKTLAPSLLLLYGEVEHTGYYDKMSHRAHIASLLKYLWESKEHRLAFRRITSDKDSFIKFANGIMNETNSLIASVMEKLPEIRRVQVQMTNATEWAALSEEQRETITSRHEENEHEVKRALPLCNKTLQMLAYLNTDEDIRRLFLLEEMCPRLVNLLLHVLTKLVGARGLELKVDNPENYNFRPRDMLRDLCSIFACFASASEFQIECAKSGYYSAELVDKSIKTCRKLNLLTGENMERFASLTENVESAVRNVADEEALTEDAPEEFMDPLMVTFMRDPVLLPTSDTIVDRSTITQHLLNDACDPFNRKKLDMDMIVPATDLKAKIDAWLAAKRAQKFQSELEGKGQSGA